MDWIEMHLGWVFLFIAGTLTLLLVCVVVSDNREHDRLLAQCLKDGHKEYQCESALRHCGGAVFIPMAIPIR